MMVNGIEESVCVCEYHLYHDNGTFAEEYTGEDGIDVHVNNKDLENVQSRRRPLSFRIKPNNLLSPLVFLGTLKCTTGNIISLAWEELTKNLCGILYVRDRFDAAISAGKDVPHIDIESILRRILNNTGIRANLSSREIITIPDITDSENYDYTDFFHISDYLGSVFRGVTFNQTGTMLSNSSKDLIKKLMDDHEYTYNIGYPQELPHPNDLVKYKFSNYAIESNTSRKAINNIVLDCVKTGMLRYWEYCTNIGKYMPLGKYSEGAKNRTIEKIMEPKFDLVITKTDSELTVLLLVLTFIGVLVFVLYAVNNLLKRNRSKIKNRALGKKNDGCDISIEIRSNALCLSSSSDLRYRHLSEFKVEDV